MVSCSRRALAQLQHHLGSHEGVPIMAAAMDDDDQGGSSISRRLHDVMELQP